MTKKIMIAVSIVVLCICGFFYNMFYGNPFSKALAKHSSYTYLKENYPNTDYEIEDVYYNLKNESMEAHVISPSSIDTIFNISMDMFGKVKGDNFEDYVASGFNTLIRLDGQYRALVDNLMTTLDMDGFGFGTLISDVKELKDTELVLDKEYDMNELGSLYGEICLNIVLEKCDDTIAANFLKDVIKKLDENNISYHHIHYSIQSSLDKSQFFLDCPIISYNQAHSTNLESVLKTLDQKDNITKK